MIAPLHASIKKKKPKGIFSAKLMSGNAMIYVNEGIEKKLFRIRGVEARFTVIIVREYLRPWRPCRKDA